MLDLVRDFLQEDARNKALKLFAILAAMSALVGLYTDSYFIGAFCASMIACCYATLILERIEVNKDEIPGHQDAVRGAAV